MGEYGSLLYLALCDRAVGAMQVTHARQHENSGIGRDHLTLAMVCTLKSAKS